MSFESVMGLAIVVGFGLYLMRDRAKRGSDGTRDEDAVNSEREEIALPSDGDWCSLLERACDCSAFCFDNSMRFVSCGGRATDLVGDGFGNMSHLIDVCPGAVSNEILKGAAAARRGEASSRQIVWDGVGMEARFMPLGPKAIAILFSGRCA